MRLAHPYRTHTQTRWECSPYLVIEREREEDAAGISSLNANERMWLAHPHRTYTRKRRGCGWYILFIERDTNESGWWYLYVSPNARDKEVVVAPPCSIERERRGGGDTTLALLVTTRASRRLMLVIA